MNERANPVSLNGKAYRGKIEVFVNARGSLTVVNVVPLEEYLLGVVPAELGLPKSRSAKGTGDRRTDIRCREYQRLWNAGF